MNRVIGTCLLISACFSACRPDIESTHSGVVEKSDSEHVDAIDFASDVTVDKGTSCTPATLGQVATLEQMATTALLPWFNGWLLAVGTSGVSDQPRVAMLDETGQVQAIQTLELPVVASQCTSELTASHCDVDVTMLGSSMVAAGNGFARAWAPDGQVKWTVTQGLNGTQLGLSHQVRPDLVYAGGYRRTNGLVKTPILLQIDDAGHTTTIIDDQSATPGRISALASRAPSGVLFWQVPFDESGYDHPAHSWIGAMDAQGQQSWKFTLKTQSFDSFDVDAMSGGLTALADGGVAVSYVGGNINAPGESKLGNACIIRLNAAGQLMWRRCLAFDDIVVSQGESVETPSGSIATVWNRQGPVAVVGPPKSWYQSLDRWGNTLELLPGQLGPAEMHPWASNSGQILVAMWSYGLPPPTGKMATAIVRLDAWGHDACVASGPCFAKSWNDCSDTNPCTADLCDGAHNGCYHVQLPDGATCADSGAHCLNGTCKP